MAQSGLLEGDKTWYITTIEPFVANVTTAIHCLGDTVTVDGLLLTSLHL